MFESFGWIAKVSSSAHASSFVYEFWFGCSYDYGYKSLIINLSITYVMVYVINYVGLCLLDNYDYGLCYNSIHYNLFYESYLWFM